MLKGKDVVFLFAVLFGGFIIIGISAFNMESFLNSMLFLFFGIAFWTVLVFAINDKIESEKHRELLQKAIKNSGYSGFNIGFELGYDLYIDKTQNLIAVLHDNNQYIIVPAYALKDFSYEEIYDYKKVSNFSAGQALADGMAAGLTGVGIIREIKEDFVPYVKGVKLKIRFNHNGYFTKEISTSVEEATEFSNLAKLLQNVPKERVAVPRVKNTNGQFFSTNTASSNPQKRNVPNTNRKTQEKSSSVNTTILLPPKSSAAPFTKIDKSTWDNRIDQALKNPPKKVEDLLAIAEEGSDRAYNLLGSHYSNLNNLQLAHHYYTLAYNINPGNANVLNNLGLLYCRENFHSFNIEKAMQYFKKSLEHHVNSSPAIVYHNIAGIYDGTLGGKKDSSYINYDNAIYYYEKALAMGYDSDVTLNNLGRLYGDKKNKFVLAACYCFLSKQKGNSTGESNYKTYINLLPEPQKRTWEENITSLNSHKKIEEMIKRVSSSLNIPPELSKNPHNIH